MVQFNRNGFAYTIDRPTGEVLVAEPFGNLNWATGIDMKTGRPVVDPAMQPKPGVKLDQVCPPDIGVKDWQPSAFSPRHRPALCRRVQHLHGRDRPRGLLHRRHAL